jgi:acylaminoacyl-peptidase
MAGVDYVLAHYPIDRKRLGVTGYSYGGFMTDWIITQTNRFAAAIAGAGISNWVSDYGTADVPRTKESEFFGAPWEAKGYRSPWNSIHRYWQEVQWWDRWLAGRPTT